MPIGVVNTLIFNRHTLLLHISKWFAQVSFADSQHSSKEYSNSHSSSFRGKYANLSVVGTPFTIQSELSDLDYPNPHCIYCAAVLICCKSPSPLDLPLLQFSHLRNITIS